MKDGSHVRLWHLSCVYITAQRQYKDLYTSEITFLALHPWIILCSLSKEIFGCKHIENHKVILQIVVCAVYHLFKSEIKYLFSAGNKIKNLKRFCRLIRFKGYCFKLAKSLFKWKVTWNYAYSPFKENPEGKVHTTLKIWPGPYICYSVLQQCRSLML